MIEELLIFAFLGIFVGLAAGMFGIGGGTLIVPVLVASFLNHGFQEDITVHLALGSSMASIFFTGIASANAHRKKKAIDYNILKPVAFGVIFGALLGAIFALQLEGSILKIIIAIFALLAAIRIGFNIELKSSESKPKKLISYVAGSLIGFLSSILGIGGGMFAIPYFRSAGLSLISSIGTSAACGIPIALFSSLGFFIMGLGNSALPNLSLGYIYLPAVFGISITSVFAAKYGAQIAHYVSTNTLRWLLASLLLSISIYMVVI